MFKSNEKILVYIISFICIITFCVALIFPPSTDDSYAYHLPRIYHWLQNDTFTNYYTTIDRQLFSAPLAEILIMYSLEFDIGSDYLVNLPQWFSFVSILFAISRICSLLGFNRRIQLLGMLFFSTLPTAILESTSTQNDLVVCLFLTIALERLLVWIKDCSLSNTLYFALALGLAVLTKGTAYIIGLPIVVIFAWYCFKYFKKRILSGIIAGLVCLSINLPHYYRNIVYFGDPLEAYPDTKSTFGTDAFIFGGPLNLYTQMPLPLPDSDNINKKITSINKEVIPYGPLKVSSDFNDFFIRLLMFHEDISINFFHFALLIVSSIIILVKHRERFPLVLWAIVLFYVFSVSVPWQPWITRLQLPMFAYFSIVFAVGIGYLKLTIQRVIISVLFTFSLLPLFMNRSRSIFYVPYYVPVLNGKITTAWHIWNVERERLRYVNNRPEHQRSKEYFSLIGKVSPRHIGLIIGLDTWEYPLWNFLKSNDSLKNVKVDHVKLDSIPSDVDLLLFKANNDLLNFDINRTKEEIRELNIYKRDSLNNWERIYPMEQ